MEFNDRPIRFAAETGKTDTTIPNEVPEEERPELLITFHLRSRVTKAIITKGYDSAMHANASFIEGMCHAYGAVSIPGFIAGRLTRLIINYQTVVFITIDEVPSEGNAE